MTLPIDIIPYESAHQEAVVELITSIQQQEFGIEITLEDQPDLLNVKGFYQKERGNFWVAKENDRIVGTIALIDLKNGLGALRKMFVRRDFRGERKGTAQALLQELLQWSAKNEFKQIYLGTTPQFHAAHRFYEKNSFLEIQKNELPSAFPLMAVDTRFYLYCFN